MAIDALQALQAFGAGRAMRIEDQTRNRHERLRTDLAGAYNPQTGAIDQTRARQAYVTAGDIPGALEFDQHMTQQAGREWTQNRDRIIAAVPFLEGVAESPDPNATYQQRLALAHAQGLDISGAPPQYDPNWVQGVLRIGTQLRAQSRAPQEPTSFQQDLAAAGIQPGTPEFRAMLENRYAPDPITSRNDDGTYTIIPRPTNNAGGQVPAPPQLGEVRRGYRFLGGDPASPQSWQQVHGPAAAGDTRPANMEAPAFAVDPNSIPSGNPLDPNLGRR